MIEVEVKKKADAEQIVKLLNERKSQSGGVAVSYLKDLIDEPRTYRDEYEGWTDLTQVTVAEKNDGFAIVLPTPSPIRYI